MKAFAEEEMKAARDRLPALEIDLQKLLLPKDPNDERNVILEIRAGTGGDESALFAGSLFRMYARYAERQRWQVEILSASESDLGGYKEVIARIVASNGQGAYSKVRSSLAAIACSACRKPKPRAASTPRPAPWR